MKKFFVVFYSGILVTFFLISFVSKSGKDSNVIYSYQNDDLISWRNYEQAVNESKSGNKIIFVHFFTDWCGWCKKLDKETFVNNKVISVINAGFIPVKVNPERKAMYKYENVDVNNRVFTDKISHGKLKTYPLFVFINPNTKEFLSHEGYLGPEEFSELLETVKQKLRGK